MDVSGGLKLSDKSTPASDYDRSEEIKAFDNTKAGVKGLVDAGIKSVPKIFTRPPDELAQDLDCPRVQLQVPVIDLDGFRGGRHKEILENVSAASQTWGFFQLVNHGVPVYVLEEMIHGVRRFHEQDVEAKKDFYSRDQMKQVRYESNFDLYNSKTASWRDTFTVSLLFENLENDRLPAVCRDETIAYIEHMKKLGKILFELLSESLGLQPNHLQSMECNKGEIFVFHYYPECPQPELTLGVSKHQDQCFLTILLQDQIGGLQVLHENQYWVDVPPIKGGLVVNIGDFLQVVSNDKLKSVAHRVVANHIGPRISMASFFSGPPKLYGPMKELLSEENPPLYRDFSVEECTSILKTEALGGRPATDYFRI
ncbi:hypothetical protein ACFE04_007250 [Oxalis oulophora]